MYLESCLRCYLLVPFCNSWESWNGFGVRKFEKERIIGRGFTSSALMLGTCCCFGAVTIQWLLGDAAEHCLFNWPLWARWAVSSELFWMSWKANRFIDFFYINVEVLYCHSLSYRCLSIDNESVEGGGENWYYLIVLVHYQWHLEPEFGKQFWMLL